MLSRMMEFAKPKKLMVDFAGPVLDELLKKYAPLVFKEGREDGVPASLTDKKEGRVSDPVDKSLPNHYHFFQFRRFYAKLRSLAHFAPQSEGLYRKLLMDELKHYQLYDSTKLVEDLPEESQLNVSREERKLDETKGDPIEKQMQLAQELTKILNQGEMNDRVQVKEYIDSQVEKIQEQYYPDMKPKFSVDYSEIRLDSARDFIERGERLHQFDQTPIMSIVKTISGMCKNFILRMKHDMAEEGMLFNIEALKVAHGVPSGQLLAVVNEKHELCKIRMAIMNYLGDLVYDT